MNERIKKIRKDNYFTQQEFGELLGVSRNVIANIENGRVDPSPLFINLLIKEFNVNKDWLETGTGIQYSLPLTLQDEKLVDLFSDLSINKNPRLVNIFKRLRTLDDEYLDAIEKLVIGLSKK